MKRDESNKTVIFTANTSWYLFNFKYALAKELQRRGYRVVCVAPHDEFSKRLLDTGFVFHDWPIVRKGMNPTGEILAIYRLFCIYRKERPKLVHHFTIKPVLYGSMVARILGIGAIVNSITGLGHIFIDQGSGAHILRHLLRIVYRLLTDSARTLYIFQNAEDRDYFLEKRMIPQERSRLVHGSGVDIKRFAPKERGADKTVLFVGRLLKEKGIYDFLAAVDMVRNKIPDAKFLIAGSPDFGNPSSLREADYQKLVKTSGITCLGHVENMAELFAQASVVVLPSYREGLPRVLLEAGAMELGLVATNVPGCREVVHDGRTGILVPVQDAKAIADAVIRLLNDHEYCERLGKAARAHITQHLSDEIVLGKTLGVYAELSLQL